MKQVALDARSEDLARLVPDRVVQRHALVHGLETARSARVELARFLLLCASVSIPLAPSQIVDALWHEFVIDTLQYEMFCERLGCFVHHVPADKPCVREYARTRQLLAEHFRYIDWTLWPESAAADCKSDCSSCGSKCRGKVRQTSRQSA